MPKLLPNWDCDDVESLRVFSRISLIAADLDGTFLESKNDEPSSTLQHLRRSLSNKKHNVRLTIATGRALAGAQLILQKLQLPRDTPLILYNGSVIIRHKSLDALSVRTMESNVLGKVLSIAKPFPVRTYAYIFGQQNESEFRIIGDLERVRGWSECGRPKFEFNGIQIDWQPTDAIPDKATPSAIVIEAASDPQILTMIEKLLSTIRQITITRSSLSFIEIRPAGSNKGIALAAAARALGLERENLLALGDSDNDVEMLSWAGIGVTVAGASKAALAASDYVCRHGVAQGAIEALRLVRAARRYFFQPKKEALEQRQ